MTGSYERTAEVRNSKNHMTVLINEKQVTLISVS